MAKAKLISGIDIGTDQITTVIASYSPETGKHNVVGVAAVESRGLRKSQIVDLEDAIGAITESVEAAERMAGYNITHSLVSITGTHIHCKNSKGVVAVADPEGEIIPDDVNRVIEAASAVSLPSAEEIIHVIPRYYTVDSQEGIKDPIGMSGVRLEAEAHLIIGSSTAIKNTVKAVEELGIQVEEMVFSGLASSHAALSDTEKELGVVLIDIGGGTTAINLFVEGAIAHTNVLPVGARNITNDIAIGMRTSLKNAEVLKRHLSETQKEIKPPSGAKASEIAKMRKQYDTIELKELGIKDDSATASRKSLEEGIIRPRLVEMSELIQKEIIEAGLEGTTPSGVVITGGGAQTVNIKEVFKQTMSLPVRISQPRGLTGLVEELQYPQFATVTGLVVHGLKKQAELFVDAPSDFFNPLSHGIPGTDTFGKLVDLVKSFLP